MKKEKNKIETFDYSAMNDDQLAKKSREDHQEIVRQLDKQDNALCLVVLGAICFIVAILFFFLSFKRVKNKMSGIDITSLQFFVCVGCAIACVVLLAIGLTRWIKTILKRKELRKDIKEIAKYRDAISLNKIDS